MLTAAALAIVLSWITPAFRDDARCRVVIEIKVVERTHDEIVWRATGEHVECAGVRRRGLRP
jgi:hypothetical protein